MILHNGESLAYLGDAIYELKIRSYLLSNSLIGVNKLHKEAVKYTSGIKQAGIIKKMLENNILTEEELEYYKRGRNSNHSANRRNISVTDYKSATGFEAVFGFLYLEKKDERIDELVSYSIKCVEEGL